MTEPTIPLREHFDEKFNDLREDFNDLKTTNADEHSAVLAELTSIKTELRDEMTAVRKELSKTVTWPSLGFALTVVVTVLGIARFVVG